MKRLCLLISFIASSYLSFSQTASATWSVKFANSMISRYSPTINAMTGKGWEYSNTIILHGMEKVFKQVPTYTTFQNYIQTYVDTYVNSTGGWISPAPTVNSLDRTHPGISCLFLYEQTGLTKYKTISTTLRNMYVGAGATYPKTAKGGIFWHKNNGSYNDIVMLDGIYMLHTFLVKYGKLFNDNAAIDTAVNQTLYVYNQLYDNTIHLIRHAWNPTKTQTWANATTGNSSEVWSRGMGWFAMALVDELKYVPAAHPKRSQLLTALANLAIGIQTYQDATTGLWYQVVDKGGQPGNYLETSGSAMFVYTIKTAVDSGWINSSYLTVAQKGWTGLKTQISTYSDGMPSINNFAPAMSVQNDYSGYVSITPVSSPATTNPHGFAAIMMAASVMEFPLTTLPVKFTGFTAKDFPAKTMLTWQVGDESDVTYYQVQKSTNGKDFKVIGQVPVAGQATYNFDDNAVEDKTVNYRINALYQDNSSHYSMILSVRRSSHRQTFEISPNPVKGGELNTVLTNFPPGKYDIYITSASGNSVYTIPLTISGETSDQRLQLPHSIAKGIYYVRLNGAGVTINKNIVVE